MLVEAADGSPYDAWPEGRTAGNQDECGRRFIVRLLPASAERQPGRVPQNLTLTPAAAPLNVIYCTDSPDLNS